MPSTLIVRDVTLAVNGAPEARAEFGDHLRSRLAAVSSFEGAANEKRRASCPILAQPV